jgi:hypothetical protein
MLPEHAKILDQLRTAFPAKPIQSEEAFRDRGATYADAQPYMKHLEGKTWEELDRAYLVMRHDALSFLGPRYIAAVLPVYLRSLVEEGAGSPAVYTLLHLLTKRGPQKKQGNSRTRFAALVGALTPEQCAAIAVILRAFAAKYEGERLGFAAQTALADQWKIYLPAGS